MDRENPDIVLETIPDNDQSIPDSGEIELPPIEAYEDQSEATIEEPPQKEEKKLTELMNAEAEMAVLGTMLTDPNVLDLIEGILKPEFFAFIGHSDFYELAKSSIIEHQTASFISIKNSLKMLGVLDAAGGNSWLASIAGHASVKRQCVEYSKIIRDLYYRRKLSNLGHELQIRAKEDDGDAGQLIEEAERELSELVGYSADQEARDRNAAVSSTLSQLEASYNSDGAITGVSTGMTRLDDRLLGLQDTNLIILAGRPGMGKTACSQCFAEFNANLYQKTDGEEAVPVLFFSLEMSAEEINMRLVSDRESVPLQNMRKGKYRNNEEWHKVVNGTQALNSLPFFIDDSAGLTSRGIWARARRMKRRHGIGLVIIDQLSHIRPADPSMRRVEALGQITKDLKAMAKELELPVVLLHQLSRGVEMRDDKRPMLSDLRDSGEIEQDADVVMFVYREQYYLERSEPSQRAGETTEKFLKRVADHEIRLEAVSNTAEIIIAKQRMGNIGKAVVAFHGAYTRFGNLDTQHSDPQQDLL